MCNPLNPSQQYSKCQNRGEEIEKCLDEGLEPTYHFSIFRMDIVITIFSNISESTRGHI